MREKYKYFNKNELSKLIGKELTFESFPKCTSKGVLTYSDNKYWLPRFGLVNAETVKIKINNNEY